MPQVTPVESTNYPDTTRAIIVGPESNEKTASTNLHLVHTVNEPAHTLTNGITILRENGPTRMKDSASARGRRGSSLRVQAYLRTNEIGFWLDSAIGGRSSAAYKDYTSQTGTITGAPTGGGIYWGYRGEFTPLVPYNATGATIQTALEALSTVAPGDITVAGAAGGPYTFTLANESEGFGSDAVMAYSALTGGTNPAVNVVAAGSVIAGAYEHIWIGGSTRGVPLTVYFFNGLYWRRMVGMRVNTMNCQAMGDGAYMVDMELVGPASTRFTGTFPAYTEEDEYQPMDSPMQFVRVAGTIDTDMDRMSLQINNNLTNRATMNRSTSVGRTRFGDFDAAIDGMADYPQYVGSYYEVFEAGTQTLGQLDVVALDDLTTIGTPEIAPFLVLSIPRPLLADTSEGDDAGELVQMIRGRARPSKELGGGIRVHLVNDKPGSYYAAA